MGFAYTLPKILRWILSIIIGLLILMTLYRLFFFYHYRPVNRPFTGSAFLLGLRYDSRISCILGLFVLMCCSIRLLNPFKNRSAQKGWTVFLCLVFLIVLIFYAADFYHYDYLQQRLNASVLNFVPDAGIAARMMWQTYPLVKIFFILCISILLCWFLLSANLRRIATAQPGINSRRSDVLTFGIAALILAIAIFGKLGQYPLRWSDAFAFGDDFKASTALNPFQSFFSSLTFRNSTYNRQKVASGYQLMASYLDVTEKDSVNLNYTRNYEFSDTLNRPNIIIVICESFSAYKSSMFGNKLDATPYFNELCSKGAFFERCFTPAFGTARGVWATVTGIPDVEDPKTASRNPSAVNQHTIINDFEGYEKLYFLGGSTTWANIRGLLTNNIDELSIYEEENFKAPKVDVWGISDKNLFLESCKILGQKQGPFISVIQTADNHRPYTIPAEDKLAFKTIEYPADTLKKYGFDDNGQLNAFRYTDYCYRQFMEAAKKEKFFDNTIFVFVGDHGLRGDAGNMFPKSFTQQGILAEHVPLLFYSPKYIHAARIRNVASQIDILPTVASIAHQNYSNTTFGRNLFDTSEKKHYAFIADPDIHSIGLVSNQYYYSRNLVTGKIDFVSVLNNDLPEDTAEKSYMARLTSTWYETAKYLLLNNKKKK